MLQIDPDRPDVQRVFLSLLAALRHLNFPLSAETIFANAAATGFKGGNRSHGGQAAVTFESNGASLNATVTLCDGRKIDFQTLHSVDITVGGDWEQQDLLGGLIQSAIVLARALYAQPR